MNRPFSIRSEYLTCRASEDQDRSYDRISGQEYGVQDAKEEFSLGPLTEQMLVVPCRVGREPLACAVAHIAAGRPFVRDGAFYIAEGFARRVEKRVPKNNTRLEAPYQSAETSRLHDEGQPKDDEVVNREFGARQWRCAFHFSEICF